VLTLSQVVALLDGRMPWTAQQDYLALLFSGTLALSLLTREDVEIFSFALVSSFGYIASGFVAVLWVWGFILAEDILYFEGVRFAGLAVNPNQFALFVLCIPLCLGVGLSGRGTIHAVGFVLLGILAVLAGLDSMSDALLISWYLLVVILMLVALILRENPKKLKPAILIMVMIVCANLFWQPLVLISSRVGLSLSNRIELNVSNPAEQNQISIRLGLYRNGMLAWMDRPLLGHGVQMVSGFQSPYEGKESHNTVIDWASWTGVLGVLSAGIWYSTMLRRAWMWRQLVGMAGMIVLLVFAQFHLVARQPLFMIMTCALSSMSTMPPPKRNVLEG